MQHTVEGNTSHCWQLYLVLFTILCLCIIAYYLVPCEDREQSFDPSHSEWTPTPDGADTEIQVAVVDANQLQGKRPYMEDFYTTHRHRQLTLITLCDGHGGDKCAEHISRQLPRNFMDAYDRAGGRASLEIVQIMVRALQHTSDRWDRDNPSENSGTTLVFTVVEGVRVHVLNVGDSRALLRTRNGKLMAVTRDHKPTPTDTNCPVIRDSFGTPRVNGYLAVGRAIGDNGPQLKGCISRTPDTYTWDVSGDNKYEIVMATDGVWDVLSSEQVAQPLTSLEITSRAFANGSSDNITSIVVSL